jgi:hypothetical protein
MASPAASQSQADAALLQCSQCLALAADPRCLPCLHLYCAGCIHELKVADLPQMVVSCVKCDVEYEVTGRDLATAFPKHFGVANAVTAAQVAAPAATGDGGAAATAREQRTCALKKHSGRVADAWCGSCSSFVCGVCVDVHDGMGHTMTPLAPSSSPPVVAAAASAGSSGSTVAGVGPAAPRAFASAPRCQMHPSDILDMYCDGEACPAPGPICMRCAVTAHAKSPPHSVHSAADVAAAKSAELGASLAAMAALHAKVAALRAGIDARKATVVANHQTSSAAVASTFDGLAAALAARRSALETELATHRDAKLKCLDLEARSIDMITGHVAAASAATETARSACGDAELVVMHAQLAARLAALQAECEAELALQRTPTVLQFACGTAGDLRAAIGTAGGVDAWGVRADDVRLDPSSPLPPSWPWGRPLTVTLLVACGAGRDPAVVRAAALQHITGSVRLVVAAPLEVTAAGGAGAAAALVPLPAAGDGAATDWEATVDVATAPAGGSLRGTLTFAARERPAAASGAAAMQITLACRGEAVAGTPLNIRAGFASLGNGTGAGAGCFGDCHAVAVHAQLNRVYVADAANRRIVMFDSNTGTFLRNNAEGQFQTLRGLAVHPVTGELWAADHPRGRLLVLDPESGATTRVVGGRGPTWGCTFNADGSMLYVAESSNNRIAVIRPADGAVTSYLAHGAVSHPSGLCVDAVGHVVVACSGTQRVSVWNPATGQEVRGITDAGSNWTSVATHNGTLYAVAGGSRNDVSVIDAGSTTVSRRITTSADGQPLTNPCAVAVHDDCLLVACSGTGRVHALPL